MGLSLVLTVTFLRIVILLDVADFAFLACLTENGEMRGVFRSGKLIPIWQVRCCDSWRSGGVEAEHTKLRGLLAEF